MVSEALLSELKQIFLENYKMQLSDSDVKELANFLLNYFGLLTGVQE